MPPSNLLEAEYLREGDRGLSRLILNIRDEFFLHLSVNPLSLRREVHVYMLVNLRRKIQSLILRDPEGHRVELLSDFSHPDKLPNLVPEEAVSAGITPKIGRATCRE